MKKLRNQKGFTLTEMLVCVITLLLVAAICATGTGMSIKSYQESRFESDSQMLESTLDTIIGDILRYASNVSGENVENLTFDNKYEYYNMTDGRIAIATEDKYANQFVRYESPSGAATPLVSEKVYAENLYVTDLVLNYDATTKLFTGSYKIKSTVISEAVRECNFSYRTIVE